MSGKKKYNSKYLDKLLEEDETEETDSAAKATMHLFNPGDESDNSGRSTYLDIPKVRRSGIRVNKDLDDFIIEKFGERGFTKFFNAAGELLKRKIEREEQGDNK